MVESMGDMMGERHGITREDAYSRIASRVPMRRVAEPREVVQAMLWIVSDANSFMTGQAISVDGGLTAV
jgi:NAD(P)-dependent dehydrogenase (short-subunit alcohol dehydrogenase family)